MSTAESWASRCTAGNPKGVVLTHENIVTAVASLHSYVHQQKIDITRTDSVLSFLTLAHILGRVVEEFAVSCGAKIGYWQVSCMCPFCRCSVVLVTGDTRMQFVCLGTHRALLAQSTQIPQGCAGRPQSPEMPQSCTGRPEIVRIKMQVKYMQAVLTSCWGCAFAGRCQEVDG